MMDILAISLALLAFGWVVLRVPAMWEKRLKRLKLTKYTDEEFVLEMKPLSGREAAHLIAVRIEIAKTLRVPRELIGASQDVTEFQELFSAFRQLGLTVAIGDVYDDWYGVRDSVGLPVDRPPETFGELIHDFAEARSRIADQDVAPESSK